MDTIHRSARTCIKQIPAVFKLVNWYPHTSNLDIGGGKFEEATKYLAERSVGNFIYDPYNRTSDHNARMLERYDYDTVTLCNVLNVIETSTGITEVLWLARRHVKVGGCIYISVYEGNRSGRPCIGKTGTWQANKRLHVYMKWVHGVFGGCQITKMYRKGSGFSYLCIKV